jgi:DNA-binding NarL/FixJ family response regulator
MARLHLAKEDPAMARAVLEQALATGSGLGRLPAVLLLIDVLLAQGETARARQYAEEAMALATPTESDLLLAQVEVAAGRVERAEGKAEAVAHFQSALERLRRLEASFVAGRARLEMARMLRESDRAGAIAWGRAALATFERIGAAQHAAEAGALLRELGATPRSKSRGQELLTAREKEVLALLKQGLSNPDIARRLVISPKTAEHHVGQILSKLGLKNRAEAAVFALTEDEGER